MTVWQIINKWYISGVQQPPHVPAKEILIARRSTVRGSTTKEPVSTTWSVWRLEQREDRFSTCTLDTSTAMDRRMSPTSSTSKLYTVVTQFGLLETICQLMQFQSPCWSVTGQSVWNWDFEYPKFSIWKWFGVSYFTSVSARKWL